MLTKLDMLIALAREGHFGRAAASLGVTQPTLSTGIRQLEDMLGVKLVQRGSRYRGLTPEGERALEMARRISGDVRRLRDDMRASHKGLAGTLRLAVIPTALTWAARLATDLTARHPDVTLTILSRASRDLLAMLDQGVVDAGLSYLDNEPLGRVQTAFLYREGFTVICRRDDPLTARGMVGWADLGGRRLALLTPDMQNRRIINRNLTEAGVAPVAGIESNSTVVLAATVAQGGWITVLPADLAAFLSAGDTLAAIPVGSASTGHAVGLIAPWAEPQTPLLQALLDAAARVTRPRV
ncbi:LysR family transcriptional regulator [Paracoccus sp. p4-l81]|uniref:LysR family transcriptional regulator n=1 Tax=Paracoccus sp. p4-l81 TaxID=3342806 RepID=UPI0035BB7D03